MAKIRFGVIVFPGTNCDRDTFWVCNSVARQDARYIWHTEGDLGDTDVAVIAGGFSYGDYLRSGAIARYSPVMKAVVRHAQAGRPVLGICNGFQVLAEAGLVRGAFLLNKTTHFICKHQHIRAQNVSTIFTSKYAKDQVLKLPIAHGEGNFFLKDDDLKYALDHDLVAFRYCGADGTVSDDTNPNGSVYSIAGIFGDKLNVLGMMPHPERSSETDIGSADGLGIFESLAEKVR